MNCILFEVRIILEKVKPRLLKGILDLLDFRRKYFHRNLERLDFWGEDIFIHFLTYKIPKVNVNFAYAYTCNYSLIMSSFIGKF